MIFHSVCVSQYASGGYEDFPSPEWNPALIWAQLFQAWMTLEIICCSGKNEQRHKNKSHHLDGTISAAAPLWVWSFAQRWSGSYGHGSDDLSECLHREMALISSSPTGSIN